MAEAAAVAEKVAERVAPQIIAGPAWGDNTSGGKTMRYTYISEDPGLLREDVLTVSYYNMVARDIPLWSEIEIISAGTAPNWEAKVRVISRHPFQVTPLTFTKHEPRLSKAGLKAMPAGYDVIEVFAGGGFQGVRLKDKNPMTAVMPSFEDARHELLNHNIFRPGR